MQLQAILLTIFVTLAAAAPVAEPQRGVPDGCRLAVRDAGTNARFRGGGFLTTRDAEPGRIGPGGHSGGSGVKERAPVPLAITEARGVRGPGGHSGGRAVAERAPVPLEIAEARAVRGPGGWGGSNP